MSDVLAIDVGSNTIKCLLARRTPDCGISALFEKSIPKRICAPGGLSENAAETIIQSVAELLQDARAHSKNFKVCCVGTSALRSAKKPQEISASLLKSCGIELEIISGDEEARLSFIGAASDPALPQTPKAAYSDLGGGSLEIARGLRRGESFEITERASFPIGAVRLAEMFSLFREPCPDGAYADAAAFCREKLAPLKPLDAGEILIASGGAVSAARIMLGENSSPAQSPYIGIRDFETLLETLKPMSAAERREKFGLPQNRADIIPAAFVCMTELMERLGAERLFHTFRSLRYGIALDFFKNQSTQL